VSGGGLRYDHCATARVVGELEAADKGHDHLSTARIHVTRQVHGWTDFRIGSAMFRSGLIVRSINSMMIVATGA